MAKVYFLMGVMKFKKFNKIINKIKIKYIYIQYTTVCTG
jgi:hypothetical protein